MKNILFATTALVATAGVASADIAISGSGEIGIFGGDGIDTQFHTDVDVTFAMTGEADNGLTFGASVDLDEGGAGAAAVANDADDGGASFFVAYGNARLDMGDTDGAFDAVIAETALAGGSINDAHTGHAGWGHAAGINLNNGMDGSAFTGGDGQIARFSYSFEGFTGHISAEQSLNGAFDTIWGVGIRYSADISNATVGVGLGYQSQNNVFDLWGLSLDTTFDNGLSAAVSYSKLSFNGGGEVEHTAIGFGYTMNALAIGINYGEYNTDFGWDSNGFGIAMSYDLGGGLTAQAGYGSSDDQILGSSDSWSLGLAMSF
ncbi:porin [Thalassococcus lentus]|uniref:Porin n=1 Tax=Thalassococcus lentus TaxID=1210524 RepID=A0ABT4XT86_9RHOB|nr:porin [Thalassococcus lentus]MDA7425160.1 porin [Thalassococcus lentus]